MLFSDKIKLRAVEIDVDASGYPTEKTTDTEVWADVKSATRAEFYAANASGINVEIVFGVHAEDFNKQTQVIYDGKTYNIIRAYQKGLGVVELVCEAVR